MAVGKICQDQNERVFKICTQSNKLLQIYMEKWSMRLEYDEVNTITEETLK